MRAQVAALAASDPLWAQVKLVLLQLDGVLLGYNAASTTTASLTLLDLILVNIEAEIGDITSAVDPDSPQRSPPLWRLGPRSTFVIWTLTSSTGSRSLIDTLSSCSPENFVTRRLDAFGMMSRQLPSRNCLTPPLSAVL